MLPLVALLLLTAPAADAGPTDPAYYWRWSDGGTAAARTLHEPALGLPPSIIVSARPAQPGRLVELQYRSPSGWLTEDSARTDARGRARLEINPYCGDGSWCDRDLTYRMRVDGRTATIRIRFAP